MFLYSHERIRSMFHRLQLHLSKAFIGNFNDLPKLCVDTYLLTELSPSSEAANCAATQELPSILWNPKVHHRVHKSPTLVPILRQMDPVHTILSYLSNIYFNIVRPPTFWSS
jgi:hypothetical protein